MLFVHLYFWEVYSSKEETFPFPFYLHLQKEGVEPYAGNFSFLSTRKITHMLFSSFYFKGNKNSWSFFFSSLLWLTDWQCFGFFLNFFFFFFIAKAKNVTVHRKRELKMKKKSSLTQTIFQFHLQKSTWNIKSF